MAHPLPIITIHTFLFTSLNSTIRNHSIFMFILKHVAYGILEFRNAL